MNDSTHGIRPMLTPSDLAAVLKIDERTLRRWRKKGVVPAPILLNGELPRWPADAIEAWMAANGQTATEDS